MRRRSAAVGSAVFFVVGPGVVAGLVPKLLTWRWGRPVPFPAPLRGLGGLLLGVGVALLVQAFVRFVIEGIGTPAPIAPPERLVVGGAYRYVRNPMYVALLATIAGRALLLGQPMLLLYAFALWLFAAAVVRWVEEPGLRRRFGTGYDIYRREVPAWVPRLRPWTPE